MLIVGGGGRGGVRPVDKTSGHHDDNASEKTDEEDTAEVINTTSMAANEAGGSLMMMMMMGLDKLGVPKGREFRSSNLGIKVDVDDTEAVAVAVRPFIVIQETPRVVPDDVDIIHENGVGDGVDMRLEIR